MNRLACSIFKEKLMLQTWCHCCAIGELWTDTWWWWEWPASERLLWRWCYLGFWCWQSIYDMPNHCWRSWSASSDACGGKSFCYCWFFVELVFCDSWCTNTAFRLLTVVPIQMLCEDRGIFLEIADFIKGLGLTILMGVMEARKNKIWARFTVEVSSAMYLRKLSSFGSLWMQEHLILHAVTFDYTHAGQQGCD